MNFTIYTYGDYESLYNAINGIKIVFNNNVFLSYFAVSALLAIIIYAINTYTERLAGANASQGQVVKKIILGLILYHLLVVPKVDIVIQDDYKNRIGVVNNVPAIIGLFGGITSGVTREIGNIIETGLGPVGGGLADIGYGAGFKMLKYYSFLADYLTKNNTYITKSVRSYLETCVSLAIAGGDISATVMNSDASVPLWNKLQTNYTSIAVTIYNSSEDQFITNCSNAYATITGYLNAATLPTSRTIDNFCALNGFDISNSAEKQKCYNTLNSMVSNFLSQPNVADFIKNAYVANILGQYNTQNSNVNATLQADIDAYSRMGGAGMQSASVAETILPLIQSTMWAILIGMAPIVMILLFFAPQNVFKWYLGMFLWLMFWHLLDSLANCFLQGKAYNLLSNVRIENTNSLLGLLELNNTATQILGMYSNVRWMSSSFSAALVYGILQVGGFALSSIASSIGSAAQGTASSVGSQSGMTNADRTNYAYQRATMMNQGSMLGSIGAGLETLSMVNASQSIMGMGFNQAAAFQSLGYDKNFSSIFGASRTFSLTNKVVDPLTGHLGTLQGRLMSPQYGQYVDNYGNTYSLRQTPNGYDKIYQGGYAGTHSLGKTKLQVTGASGAVEQPDGSLSISGAMFTMEADGKQIIGSADIVIGKDGLVSLSKFRGTIDGQEATALKNAIFTINKDGQMFNYALMGVKDQHFKVEKDGKLHDVVIEEGTIAVDSAGLMTIAGRGTVDGKEYANITLENAKFQTYGESDVPVYTGNFKATDDAQIKTSHTITSESSLVNPIKVGDLQFSGGRMKEEGDIITLSNSSVMIGGQSYTVDKAMLKKNEDGSLDIMKLEFSGGQKGQIITHNDLQLTPGIIVKEGSTIIRTGDGEGEQMVVSGVMKIGDRTVTGTSTFIRDKKGNWEVVSYNTNNLKEIYSSGTLTLSNGKKVENAVFRITDTNDGGKQYEIIGGTLGGYQVTGSFTMKNGKIVSQVLKANKGSGYEVLDYSITKIGRGVVSITSGADFATLYHLFRQYKDPNQERSFLDLFSGFIDQKLVDATSSLNESFQSIAETISALKASARAGVNFQWEPFKKALKAIGASFGIDIGFSVEGVKSWSDISSIMENLSKNSSQKLEKKYAAKMLHDLQNDKTLIKSLIDETGKDKNKFKNISEYQAAVNLLMTKPKKTIQGKEKELVDKLLNSGSVFQNRFDSIIQTNREAMYKEIQDIQTKLSIAQDSLQQQLRNLPNRNPPNSW